MPEQKEELPVNTTSPQIKNKQEILLQRVWGKKILVLSGSTLTYLFSLVGCAGADQPKNYSPEPKPSTPPSGLVDKNPTAKPTAEPTFTVAPRPTIAPTPSPTPKPENLKYKDRLPTDMVSYKELEEVYHTKIYNTPDVKFHLRQAALTEESIFQWLKTKETVQTQGDSLSIILNPKFLANPDQSKINKGITIQQEVFKSLDIILVNGPVVHPKYMTEEQRKIAGMEYHPKTPREIEESKEEVRKSFEKHFQEDQQSSDVALASGKITKEQHAQDLKWTEAARKALSKRLERWTETDVINRQSELGDHRINSLQYSDGRVISDKRTILIAVQADTTEKISIDGGGYLAIVSGYRGLDPADSFPSPDSLIPIQDEKGYEIAGETTGWITHHETAHFQGTGTPAKRASKLKLTEDEIRKLETQADRLAASKIKKAYEAFKRGDDSLYYFVFETPRGNVVTDMPKRFTDPNRKDTRVARGPIKGPQGNFRKGNINPKSGGRYWG